MYPSRAGSGGKSGKKRMVTSLYYDCSRDAPPPAAVYDPKRGRMLTSFLGPTKNVRGNRGNGNTNNTGCIIKGLGQLRACCVGKELKPERLPEKTNFTR